MSTNTTMPTSTSTTTTRTSAATNALRVRWAAIGAAIAVAVGGGTIGVVSATDTSGTRAVFTAITPCRLVDTRPAPSTVGPRTTPLDAAEIATFRVHGTNGDCTIPAEAVAIDANVTITGPTSDSFLTIFPTDAQLPNASNLNWTAGQAPTPNAVTVDLSADGKLNVFNERGTVNVIIDIVGYYADHAHDDRYHRKSDVHTKDEVYTKAEVYTKTETDARGVQWIVVTKDGAILDSSAALAGTTVQKPAVGVYCIDFPVDANVAAAPAVASVVRDNAGPIPSFISVTRLLNSPCSTVGFDVAIETYDAAGAPANRRFTVLVPGS